MIFSSGVVGIDDVTTEEKEVLRESTQLEEQLALLQTDHGYGVTNLCPIKKGSNIIYGGYATHAMTIISGGVLPSDLGHFQVRTDSIRKIGTLVEEKLHVSARH